MYVLLSNLRPVGVIVLVVRLFVQVLFQFVKGVRDRAVAALLFQPFQAGQNAVTKKRLLFLDAANIVLLQLAALDGFVQRNDGTDDNADRADDLPDSDDSFPVDVHTLLLYWYCHAIAPFTSGVTALAFRLSPRTVSVV